jgi:hypothetical protein
MNGAVSIEGRFGGELKGRKMEIGQRRDVRGLLLLTGYMGDISPIAVGAGGAEKPTVARRMEMG